MKTTRRKFTSKFKTKVVLEALKERETIHQIAARYEIHPTQINTWKRHFLDSAEGVFEGNVKRAAKSAEEDQEKLYKKIGKLQMEVDFLKKSLGED
jgi:transposase-like protein